MLALTQGQNATDRQAALEASSAAAVLALFTSPATGVAATTTADLFGSTATVSGASSTADIGSEILFTANGLMSAGSSSAASAGSQFVDQLFAQSWSLNLSASQSSSATTRVQSAYDDHSATDAAAA